MNKPAGLLDDRFGSLIENIDTLPPLPLVVNKVFAVINSPESSAEDAAKLIEKDPVLTAHILRLANSAFYGMPRSISSVSSAVVVLGFNTIRSLVLSMALVKMFPANSKMHGIDRMLFWKHCIVCGLAGKRIIQRQIHTLLIDPESVFCAGIMHDIGMLLFDEYSSGAYKEICTSARVASMPLVVAEQQMIGLSHDAIGHMIADRWGLPPDLEAPIVYHHKIASAPRLSPNIAAVHVADCIAHAAGANLWDGQPVGIPDPQALAAVGLAQDDYTALCESISAEIDKAEDFFSIIVS